MNKTILQNWFLNEAFICVASSWPWLWVKKVLCYRCVWGTFTHGTQNALQPSAFPWCLLWGHCICSEVTTLHSRFRSPCAVFNVSRHWLRTELALTLCASVLSIQSLLWTQESKSRYCRSLDAEIFVLSARDSKSCKSLLTISVHGFHKS